ncbi:MAG: molybdopterin molybdotransferase MoeA, partial [Chloroflexi bacterium]|nr:molybdopterin molybdotransferase MoeA [Chloroflexota bacterium]
VEYTETVDAETLEVTRPVAPGENVVRLGDDVRQGAVIVPRGRRLRPQDLGALAGVGVTTAPVYRRPRVGIVPTGDEIVPPDATPGPGQVRDINSTALAAAVIEVGAEPRLSPIVRDDPQRLREEVSAQLSETELLLVAGGSSVGTRDWTLEVLLGFPGAELLLHGVAIRPGKPVIAVSVGPRLVIGLPGNPVSALIVFQQFVVPVIERLSGVEKELSWALRMPGVPAVMATSCASDAGKEDYVRVRLRRGPEGLIAEPVLGKSALIMPLVQADGLVVIPEGVEGIEAGEHVLVRLC